MSQFYSIDSFGNNSFPVTYANGGIYTPAFDSNNRAYQPCADGFSQVAGVRSLAYDASGNELCDSNQDQATRYYAYDGDSRLASIAMSPSQPFLVNSDGADGSRIREQNYTGPITAGKTFTEYTYFNGQPIAEKDQTGAWTDYVYANGKKIAMVQGSKPLWHMWGTRDNPGYGSCGAGAAIQLATSLTGLPVLAGDQLVFDIQEAAPNGSSSPTQMTPHSGLGFFFQDGSASVGATDQTSGQIALDLAWTDGAWHHVSADLSSYAAAGEAYNVPVMMVTQVDASATGGRMDTWVANAEIVRGDGSVLQLYDGQPVPALGATSCAGHDYGWATEMTPVVAPAGTTFYVADHLGSAQMEFSASGTPLSMSQFMPFGAEINPPVTANHYKFTGKERDAESGLDYFGARYYGSNMGRFMSPDPFLNSGHPWDPQSWNRYSYVRNNPLSRIDPTGLYDFSSTCGTNDSACQANQKRFNDAISKAQALLKGMDPSSDQAKALSKALGALGTAGDGNGVTVGFGKTVTGGMLETVGMHLTVDFKGLDEAQSMASGTNGYHYQHNYVDKQVDDAAQEVHEGIHVANNKLGILASNEAEAYRASSYTSEAGRSYNTSGVWNPSWANGPDRNIIEQTRTNAINDAAKRSESLTNAYENGKKQ